MRRAVSALALGSATAALLRRLREELQTDGKISPRTAAAMYSDYALHAAGFLVALRREPDRTAGTRPLTVAATVLASAGAVLTVTGMARFGGPSELTGTTAPPALQVRGVYRVSRNPQYTGYLAFLTGVGLARRSSAALALTVGLGSAFAWWIPVEERALRERFGPAYDDYTATTKRWLGLPAP